MVLWRENNIMNCFTLEASFQGYFNHARETRDFEASHFYKVGGFLAKALFEYILIKETEEKQLFQRRKEKREAIMKRPDFSNSKKQVLSPSTSSEAGTDDIPHSDANKIGGIRKKIYQAQ